MLNMDNWESPSYIRESPSYSIGVLLPALTGVLVILYEAIFNSVNTYTTTITNTLFIFMYFNIAIREIVINKSKLGYYCLCFLVTILLVLYRHNR